MINFLLSHIGIGFKSFNHILFYFLQKPHNFFKFLFSIKPAARYFESRCRFFSTIYLCPFICRQINAPEMQQFVVQPSTVLNATSSVSQSVPIHGTADSSKIVAPTTSAQQMQPQPTQVMFPISVNVRAGLPGQLDSGQSQFMPAQVSSVNVNTGGNMATKGAMMRPIPPVSAPMFEMSSAGSMHHVIGMEGQITPAAMPPKVSCHQG